MTLNEHARDSLRGGCQAVRSTHLVGNGLIVCSVAQLEQVTFDLLKPAFFREDVRMARAEPGCSQVGQLRFDLSSLFQQFGSCCQRLIGEPRGLVPRARDNNPKTEEVEELVAGIEAEAVCGPTRCGVATPRTASQHTR